MPVCLPDLARVLEMLPDPVVVLDADGTLLWVNHATVQFAGMDPAEWLGRSVFELLHPDDHALALAAFGTVTGKNVGSLIDVRIRDGHDRWRHCELRGRSIDSDDGGEPTIVIGFRDAADRRGLELGAGDAELLRALVHHATSLLVTLDEHGCITSANAELTRLLGYDLALILGDELSALVQATDRPAFRDALGSVRDSFSAEFAFHHADGHNVVLDVSVTNLCADPLINGFVLSATDISDLKTTQQALRHMADHDALTGVLSRRAFLSRLDRMANEGFDHEIVVLFCDLDGFKPVNDRFGHASGDEVLIEVARRIERAVRPDDLVGRLGGDEFVVALPRAGLMLAGDIATRIRDSLTEPIIVDDEIVEIDVSIGTSVTTDQPTAVQLLAAADDAMYAVKRSRRRNDQSAT